jgi:hypothetical protein
MFSRSRVAATFISTAFVAIPLIVLTPTSTSYAAAPTPFPTGFSATFSGSQTNGTETITFSGSAATQGSACNGLTPCGLVATPSGTISYTIPGFDGLTLQPCTVTGSQSITKNTNATGPPTVEAGPVNSPPGAFGAGIAVGTPVFTACDNPEQVGVGGGALTPLTWPTSGTTSSTYTLLDQNGNSIGSITFSWQWGTTTPCTQCGPKAVINIGPSNPIPRAETVNVDGSSSTDDAGTIVDYKWSYAAGSDCHGAALTKTTDDTGSNPKLPSFQVLCSVVVTLTVRDNESPPKSDTTTKTIIVNPRITAPFDAPAFERTVDTSGQDLRAGAAGILTEPIANWNQALQSDVTQGVTFGTNVSGCTTRANGSDIFCIPCPSPQTGLCPLPLSGSLGSTGAYKTMQVKDGGPFDKFSYVSGINLTIDRKELINPNITPGGNRLEAVNNFGKTEKSKQNFFQANPTNSQAFLTAVEAHEGMGDTSPLQGHSGTDFALSRPDQKGDANQQIESVIAAPVTDIGGLIDPKIRSANILLANESADAGGVCDQPFIWPLPGKSINYWAADAGAQKKNGEFTPAWSPVTVTVPDQSECG